jgi:hypothetical protein
VCIVPVQRGTGHGDAAAKLAGESVDGRRSERHVRIAHDDDLARARATAVVDAAGVAAIRVRDDEDVGDSS